jgi:hypothetical protein
MVTAALAGAPSWQRAERELAKARQHLEAAHYEEEFATVGLCCLAALISVAQAVYDPDKHCPEAGQPPSTSHAALMLDGYVAKELSGPQNARVRKVIKDLATLAEEVKHSRTSDRTRATICLAATEAVVRVVAAVAGATAKRDP